MQFFNNVIKKRSIAFILSDFRAKDFNQPLRILGNKHDLIGLQLFDPVEENLQDIGFIQSYDMESGLLKWMDTSDRALRLLYEEEFKTHLATTKDIFNKSQSDLIQLRTDHSYVEALMAFFKKRSKAA